MTQDTATQWLPFYLRDHMAGATAGVNLFGRVAGGHSDYEVRTQVARLGTQVQQDRTALGKIMTDLGIRQISFTMLTGALGELAGRFKPNGHLTTRSPGADVLELEALAAAVQGKACVWETLLALAEKDPRLDTDQLRDLSERATDQRDTSFSCTPASSAPCSGDVYPVGQFSPRAPGAGRTHRSGFVGAVAGHGERAGAGS